ncbi:MAG: tetratricopeptide repeat protein, partial [Deltaproteobacteria bacterium]
RMADTADAGAASDRAQEAESERRAITPPREQKPLVPQTEPAPPVKPVPEAPPKPAEPAKGGKKGPLAVVAGIAVLALLAGGYFLMGKGKGPADTTLPATAAKAPAAAAVAPSTSSPATASPPTTAPPAAPSAEAESLVRKAEGLAESKPAEAKTLLQQAIAKDPRNVQAYFQLGHACVKLKEYPKALEAYTKASEIDPNFADAFFNMGYVYAVRKEYGNAEKMYSKVVALSPMYVDEALFNLGMVQEKQGKREESLQNIEKALSINPGNEPARKALARMKGK